MAQSFDPQFVVHDEKTLRSLFPPTHEVSKIKVLRALDRHARDFINRSPFLCIGTRNTDGKADVSPRGDPVGSFKILDDKTIAIPERPGNNRLDTLANIVANPNVGLLFLIPGYDETLRINGRATLITEPGLLASMAVNDRTPALAIVVTVEEVFLHCAKAFRRSKLWDPAHRQDRDAMPSLMQMLHDQTSGAPVDEAEMQKRDADLELDYRNSMY